MLTPSQSNPSSEVVVSGPQECWICGGDSVFCRGPQAAMSECERRNYHRVHKMTGTAGDFASCYDCQTEGTMDWGRTEMLKQRQFLEELGSALEDLGNKELRERARVRAALEKL